MLTLLGCSLESREQCPSVSPYSQIINKKWMQSILLRGWSSHECREIVMPLQEFFKKNMISHIYISWMKSLNNTQLLNFRRKEKLMIASVFQFILQRLIHFDFFHSNLRVTFSYLFYFFNISRSYVCVFSCKKILNAKHFQKAITHMIL